MDLLPNTVYVCFFQMLLLSAFWHNDLFFHFSLQALLSLHHTLLQPQGDFHSTAKPTLHLH